MKCATTQTTDIHESENEAIRVGLEKKATVPPCEKNTTSLAKQEAILKVCEEMKASVVKQQEDINLLKCSRLPWAPLYDRTVASEPVQPRIWPKPEVRKRPTAILVEAGTAVFPGTCKKPEEQWTNVKERPKKERKKPESRQRPDVIIVKSGKRIYSEIFKRIRKDKDVHWATTSVQ